MNRHLLTLLTCDITIVQPITPFLLFRFQACARSLKPNEFICDIHVPELLVFAAGTDLHRHELYIGGSIVLQDKVLSCYCQTRL